MTQSVYMAAVVANLIRQSAKQPVPLATAAASCWPSVHLAPAMARILISGQVACSLLSAVATQWLCATHM